MTLLEVLRTLPLPHEPAQVIACDTILFQELVVAREQHLCIGSNVRVRQPAGPDALRFVGRLTEAGLRLRQTLEAEQHG